MLGRTGGRRPGREEQSEEESALSDEERERVQAKSLIFKIFERNA